MKLYLTSNMGGNTFVDGKRVPAPLYKDNGFTDQLKKDWKASMKGLMISSDPNNYERNDSIQAIFEKAFPMSGLPVEALDLLDDRNTDSKKNQLNEYDFIILCGGHVPTQNQFFARIGLKDLIKGYDGIVIGISAGTMNCAEIVYAQAELEEEAGNPEYQKYLPGLGLTNINILPHFQELQDMTISGLRVIEDISLPDSKERPFYALVDGSYVLVEKGSTTLYGEGYWIENGVITKVCEREQKSALPIKY